MKRILSLLLAAALAGALLTGPAWAADPAPWVEVNGAGTVEQTISLRGLSGSYDSLQITLTLDKVPTAFVFDAAFSGGEAHTAYTVSGNSVTLYVTSQNQINQGEAILLGMLTGPDGYKVVSASALKLLDLDAGNLREESYSQVGVGGAGVFPFTDVPEGAWYRDAAAYVYGKGLMNGTGDTTFSPNGATTRAMIVTILWRIEGEPVVNYLMPFTDVSQSVWYTDAVRWAASERIVNGLSDTRFGPTNLITREQFAAILYRYAQYKGVDVSGRADLSARFTDAGQIRSYAWEPMAWASHAGLINGVDAATLQPRGSATRAQAAAILMRFCENIVQ